MLDARMTMKMKLKVPTEDFAGSFRNHGGVLMYVISYLFLPHARRREHCSPSRPKLSRLKTPA
jgi:hypothetical protein